MKTISIRQPWAQLLCAGIKDVENRSWEAKNTPLRVLIHTGTTRVGVNEDNAPLCWSLPIENAQIMGQIGTLKSFPTSAIIGVATIERCTHNYPSVWSEPGEENFTWVMKDAKLFKEPILGVKGKLNIYDIPELSESNLPECVDTPQLERKGTNLRFPLSKDNYDGLMEKAGDCISLNILDDIAPMLVDADGNPLPTETITFYHENQEHTVELIEVEAYDMLDSEENPVPVVYDDPCGTERIWRKISFTIKLD